MSYEIRHKAKGFAKNFETKEEVKAFLDEEPGRAEAWEGHENLNLAALAAEATKADFDKKFADHAANTEKAKRATENKPVKRAPAKVREAPAVKKIAQKTTVRKPAKPAKAKKKGGR